mmetsp:Transcript_22557/g.47293  ORF Transcript_22557/g.47293 Transcript_22557/m.47293 type:complete len:92 (-) Transcript_22557:4-279(-)
MLRLLSKTRIFEQTITAESMPEGSPSAQNLNNCHTGDGDKESDLIVGFPDIPRRLSSKKLKREVRFSSRATVHRPEIQENQEECKPYSTWY